MDKVLLFPKRFPVNREKLIFSGALAIAFLLIVLGTYWFLPMGVDWKQTYRPAALRVLSFQTPYNTKFFHSPPWTVLPIIPLALLPERLGCAINFALGLAATGFVAYRLGAKPIAQLFLLFSYPILFMGEYGQVDWLIYLGFILPPQWGLFFVLIKPQVSIGLIIFWFVEAIREGGIKKTVITFLPVSLALLVSFLIYGNWFQTSFMEVGKGFSASLWPQSIPIGLVLLVSAVRQRKANLAIISSPFLAPYLAPHGWGGALVALSPALMELMAASIGLWILRFMTGRFLH